MSNDQAIRGFYPGYRARKIAKIGLVSSLILLTVLASIGTWLPGLVGFFGSLLPPSTSQTLGACPGLSSSPTSGTSACPSPISVSRSITPNSVGADALSKISLPKTVVSSVDKSLLAGGVIQASTNNLTLYNPAITLRLLGGPIPHDEILSRSYNILSSYLFWGVQANISGIWTSLSPVSNNFTIIGTNATGTFLVRAMKVSLGSYTGVLDIVYKATTVGPLKWDLKFSPVTSGNYRIGLTWLNLTSANWLSPKSKQFTVRYGVVNYTLGWSDISTFGTIQSVTPGQFVL